MPNALAPRHRRLSDPAIAAFDVFPNDSQDLAHVASALNVATPGTVRVTTEDGSTADITVHPGHAFPIRVRRVWLTGTTATGIRGLA